MAKSNLTLKITRYSQYTYIHIYKNIYDRNFLIPVYAKYVHTIPLDVNRKQFLPNLPDGRGY